MLHAKEIYNHMKANQGENIAFGNGYIMQIFQSKSLQANVRYKDSPILKIEERTEGCLHFFLRANDNDFDISYATGCVLSGEDLITDIAKTFQEHRDIERVLIALLELK